MAYGLLLYKEIDTPQGVQRIEIYKDGYTGSAVEIAGLHRDGITISKDSGELAQPITTSVLSISLSDCGEVDYSQFFTPNSTLFKVVWKMDGSPRWTGFITPDSFAENLSYRDTITLTARDNLGRLNDYNFSLAARQMVSVRDIINEGLSVAGVAMNTVFSTTKVASEPSSTLAVDGVVNTSLLVGKSWYDALSLLLSGLGLTLAWNDANKFEIRDISQAPSNNQSAFFIQKSGFRQIRPAWKNYTVDQDYGLRNSFYEGQFSAADCGDGETFTPPSGSPWEKNGTFNLLNPYLGAPYPSETLYIPIAGGNETQNNIAYRTVVPVTDTAIKISLKVNNTAWIYRHVAGPNGNTGLDYTNLLKLSEPSSYWTGFGTYYLRFRCDIILHANNKFYFLRENWIEFGTALISPYLYFIMPTLYNEPLNPATQSLSISETMPNVDMDNEISIYIGSIPYAGELMFVIYEAAAQYLEDDDPWPQASWLEGSTLRPAYMKISDIKMSVEDGLAGREKLVTVNAEHNIQNNFAVSVGQVPEGKGNSLLYLGGLFHDDDVYTPLSDFARDAGGTNYDLLELVAREHISYNNAAYNALSGQMRTDSATFRFDKSITYGGNTYRIVGASLAILSNTLSVQLLQQEAAFTTATFTIEDVVVEGSGASGTTGGIGQGASNTANNQNLLVLAEGLAKVYARVTSLEDWLLQPAFDDITANANVNVAGRINLGGMEMEYDAENGAWHLIGNLYADGWISAGGISAGGGGGGGGIDLGAMWTSLRNTPTQTSDVTTTTKIALAHLPYTAGNGIGIDGNGVISLAASGVAAGTYYKVTVDAYGRVTAADGGVDLGAMWTSLTNEETAAGDVTSNTKIALAHLPYTAGAGINISNAGAIALTTTGVTAGTYNLVTVDAYGRITAASNAGTAEVEKVFAENLAGLTARVSSLEDWLLNPSLDSLYVADLGADTASVKTALYAYGTLDVTGLATLAGGAKLTTTKKIWFGDNAYIELDTNGYLHTNIGFYSDAFVSAGGVNTGGGSGGGLDLGAMWTSLCNQSIPTSSVNANTKIAVAHIPDITTSKISDLNTWWTTQKGTLGLTNFVDNLAISGTGNYVASLSKTGTVLTATLATLPTTTAIELTLSEAFAGVSARVASLEDWLLAPAAESFYAGDFGASTANLVDAYVLHRLWFGEHYIELDADGHLHTDTSFYADGFVSAGGVNSGGSGGTLDLGAMWTSLCNTPMTTADVTSNTKIALAHLPYSAGAGISIGSGGAISLAASGVAAGTYGSVTVDTYGRVTNGSAPAALTFGSKTYDGTTAQTLTAGDIGALTAHQTIYTLTINNSAGSAVLSWNPASANGSLTLTKAMVGLGNVENQALSYWTGSSYIRTVGTITSGTWHGSAISNTYLENSAITLAGTSVSLGGSLTANQLRSLLSISNVENTALSTWTGSGYINRVGTITSGTWNGSKITNSYIQNPYVTIAEQPVYLGSSLSSTTLLSALGLTSAASDIATLSTYFTNGIANQAARLSGTYTRSAWGQTFWSNGVPSSISGAMTGVDSINGFLYITNNNSRLGIGTSQPISNLHVAGGAYVTGSIITDSYIYIGGTSAYIQYTSGGLHTNVGFSSSSYITAGSVGSSSDARLKKNLHDVVLDIADIAKAPAVEFDWVGEGGKGAGSIAQYWQDLLPYNVYTCNEDGVLSMEYGNIALLAAITLARGYETHEEKIARLEKRVAYLENELQTLKY